MKRMVCILALIVLSLLLVNCAPAPTVLSPVTTAPTSALTQTSPPEPTEASSPTSTPMPTPTPDLMRNWSTTASSGTELSFAFPGEWFGAASLPFGEGVYVKHPDKQLGVIFQLALSGNPAQLSAAWGSKPVDITALLNFTPESVVDGEPFTVSRLEVPSRIATGGGLTAQSVFIQRPKDVMQIIWFAPSEEWEDLQEVFVGVLESVEIWEKQGIGSFSLQTMMLHDWPSPGPAWDGTGYRFQSPDSSLALALWKRDIADPVQLLAAWKPDALADAGLIDCSSPQPGPQFGGLNGQWESVTGTCKDAAGSETTYAVSFLPNRDRVLEILVYAPTAAWDKSWEIFSTMLSMLVDLR